MEAFRNPLFPPDHVSGDRALKGGDDKKGAVGRKAALRDRQNGERAKDCGGGVRHVARCKNAGPLGRRRPALHRRLQRRDEDAHQR